MTSNIRQKMRWDQCWVISLTFLIQKTEDILLWSCLFTWVLCISLVSPWLESIVKSQWWSISFFSLEKKDKDKHIYFIIVEKNRVYCIRFFEDVRTTLIDVAMNSSKFSHRYRTPRFYNFLKENLLFYESKTNVFIEMNDQKPNFFFV